MIHPSKENTQLGKNRALYGMKWNNYQVILLSKTAKYKAELIVYKREKSNTHVLVICS